MSPFPGEEPGFDPNAAANAANAALMGQPPSPGAGSTESSGSPIPDDFGTSASFDPNEALAAASAAAAGVPGAPAVDPTPIPTPGTNLGARTSEALEAVLADQEATMHLSKLSSAERDKLPKSSFAIPEDRSYPIHDESHARNALSRAAGKPEESRVRSAVCKKFPKLCKKSQTNASQEKPEASMSIYDNLALAEEGSSDGLVWKAICKTGELALSPGPGQIDVEKPLRLTPELFSELKASVDDPAFPYVTVPITHENGLLDNTGYVRQLDIKDSTDSNDPPGTQVLMAGIEFTEPQVKEKVLRGTIPDTSVGVKFNYRRKRDGKTYPAALEHVALTHQPWVDGLEPFGQALSQPYDQGQESSYMGVYVHPKDEEPAPERKDTLQRPRRSGGMPSMARTATTPRRSPRSPERREVPETVEQLMASHTVAIESAEKRAQDAEEELRLTQERLVKQENATYLSGVQAKIKEYESAGYPPALIRRYEAIALSCAPGADQDEDGVLKLSIVPEGATAKDGEEPQAEETELSSPVEVAEFMLEATPRVGVGDLQTLMREHALHAATTKPAEKSAAEKADEIEREAHPERFDENGARKEAS